MPRKTAAVTPPKPKPSRKKAAPQGAKRERGRPTLCTPELTQAICAHIGIGIAFKTACAAQGITEAAGHLWMARGEAAETEADAPYIHFFESVSRARARGEVYLHELTLTGGKGSSMAGWMLERRFRDHYGPMQRIEHSGPAGKPIEQNIAVNYAALDDDELRRIAEGG
jgi:hypothetical protein